MKKKLFFTAILFFLVAVIGELAAQKKTSKPVMIIPNTSTCGLYSPHQVDVERFLQISHHDKNDLISGDELLDLNLSLGNATVNDESNSIFLQIAISTRDRMVGEVKHPLNVCLVVDRSSSMSENGRMEKLKIALKEFCKMFGPSDYVSIVVYDDSPQVLFPAQKVTDINQLYPVIDNISLGGGTNILAGMLAGYQEIEKNFSPFFSNRLILMTDGISTVGVTNPKDIVAKSKEFNKKGIETSTLGLGAGINFDLLNHLAVAGKGLSHFIGDCDSLRGDVWVALKEELESLAPVAKEMKLTIDCPKNVQIAEIYGFGVEKGATHLEIPLCNIGQGQNKTILVRLEVNDTPRKPAIPLDVQLSYFNTVEHRTERKTRSIRSLYVRKSNKQLNMLSEDEVRHSFTIAYVAEELKRSLLLLSVKKYVESNGAVYRCLNDLSKEKDLPRTENFELLYKMLLTQQLFLREIGERNAR